MGGKPRYGLSVGLGLGVGVGVWRGGWVGIRGRCSGMGMGCRREGDWADGWIGVGVPSGQLFTMNYKF